MPPDLLTHKPHAKNPDELSPLTPVQALMSNDDYQHAAAAFKALAAGVASDTQQKDAIDFLLNKVCCTYEPSFRPSSDRLTAFAEGKRFVGLQLVELLNLTFRR